MAIHWPNHRTSTVWHAGRVRFNRAYCHQAVCGPVASLHSDRTAARQHPRLAQPQSLPQHAARSWSLCRSCSRTMVTRPCRLGRSSAALKASWIRNRGLPPKCCAVRGRLEELCSGRTNGRGKGAAYEAADVPDDGYPDGKLAQSRRRDAGKAEARGAAVLPRGRLLQAAPAVQCTEEVLGSLRSRGVRARWMAKRGSKARRRLPITRIGSWAVTRTCPKTSTSPLSRPARCVTATTPASATSTRRSARSWTRCTRLGLDQNTIVVLWGDHGWSLGEKDRWCKGTNFERDTRVPLLIRVPGLTKPGASTDSLMEYVDIYPTLAALAGLTPPADLDGRSLVPVLQDPAAHGRDVALSQFTRPWKAAGFECHGLFAPHPDAALHPLGRMAIAHVSWPRSSTITAPSQRHLGGRVADRTGERGRPSRLCRIR